MLEVRTKVLVSSIRKLYRREAWKNVKRVLSKTHVADIAAVISAMRKQFGLPVWLIGTSRGTQSVAYAATQLPKPDAPDGIVLTATILKDPRSVAVPDMALDKLALPTLVVHHANDQCRVCLPADLPRLASVLGRLPRFQLQMISGGISARGGALSALPWPSTRRT